MRKGILILFVSMFIAGNVLAHEHHAPHGGTLIELSEEEFAHLELVLDSQEGKLTGYVLDGEAEKSIRIPQEEIELKTKDKGDIVLKAVANPLTGETVGDTSEFSTQSDNLKSITTFEGSVVSVLVKGKEFDNVSFTFSKDKE